jgi:hypothetical protein
MQLGVTEEQSSQPETIESALNFGGHRYAGDPRGRPTVGNAKLPNGKLLGARDCSAVEPRCILANREIGVPRTYRPGTNSNKNPFKYSVSGMVLMIG